MKHVSNPPNPWATHTVDWLGEPPSAPLEIYEESAKSILSENDSPDLGFRFSVNPYRGCFHACAYCYARPTHQYLEFGAGTDFERKLVVKINAPELLREAFLKKKWLGEVVMLSGNTDCYQPLEASYKLTRGCLEVCREFRNPVSLITKSPLIQRDVELIAELARVARAHVYISIAFSEDGLARALETGAPVPSARFRAMKALSDAGIPVGMALAPIIPGLNESQVPELLERAYENGARRAFMTLLRLAAEVKPVFIERLQTAFPQRANKVLNGLRAMRGGELYKSGFHQRMSGEGDRWQIIQRTFEIHCKRLGINGRDEKDIGNEFPDQPSTFRRPETGLFANLD